MRSVSFMQDNGKAVEPKMFQAGADTFRPSEPTRKDRAATASNRLRGAFHPQQHLTLFRRALFMWTRKLGTIVGRTAVA